MAPCSPHFLLASTALLLAAGSVAPLTLGAQEQHASVRVSARVLPARPRLAVAPSPHPDAPRVAVGATGTGRPLTVRAAGTYEVLVWRRADAPNATPVWVDDHRGRARALAPGGSVMVGGGPAGEHRVPAPRYRIEADEPGRVALVYEVRLIGETQ
jgi:hypothetical protein